MTDDEARDALRRHWAASDVNDFATEHEIYRTDAVLEYPQSGERIRGRAHIEASRAAQPNAKRFTVRRVGSVLATIHRTARKGDRSSGLRVLNRTSQRRRTLWVSVTSAVMTYRRQPSR